MSEITRRERRYYPNPKNRQMVGHTNYVSTEPASAPGSVGGGKQNPADWSGDLGGRQITLSEGHPYRGRFSGEDQGGDFFTQKYWVDATNNWHTASTITSGWSGGRSSTAEMQGDIFVNPKASGNLGNLFVAPSAPQKPTNVDGELQWGLVPFGINLGTNGATDAMTLDSVGASLVARCRPAQSPASLATALMELKRDGLPDLPTVATWRDRLKPQKGASSEFLNYTFGIAPLLSDIKDVGYAISHREKLVRQLMRDNGRLVRRRFSLPTMVNTETLVDQSKASYLALWPAGGRNSGFNTLIAYSDWRRTVVRTITDTYSFSGAFRYYLGENEASLRNLSRTADNWRWLLGLDLNPETIYNVMPWSWLIDWGTNLGDVISNVNSFLLDGLVMPYGYVMRKRTVSIVATMTSYGPLDSKVRGVLPSTVSTTYKLVQKERRKANPFGFGLKDGDLSLKQKAILAALGLSRGK